MLSLIRIISRARIRERIRSTTRNLFKNILRFGNDL